MFEYVASCSLKKIGGVGYIILMIITRLILDIDGELYHFVFHK